MRILSILVLGLVACGSPAEQSADARSPAECTATSTGSDSSSLVALSVGWSQSHSHVQDLVLLPEAELQCCRKYVEAVTGDVPVGAVTLVFHQNGPGSYEIVPGHTACRKPATATDPCTTDFQARAIYVAEGGQEIEGTGTLTVASGGVFDAHAVSGSVDVRFAIDGAEKRLQATFAGVRCGTE